MAPVRTQAPGLLFIGINVLADSLDLLNTPGPVFEQIWYLLLCLTNMVSAAMPKVHDVACLHQRDSPLPSLEIVSQSS